MSQPKISGYRQLTEQEVVLMNEGIIDERGMKWLPWQVEFESPEGNFGITIYAISLEHAELQLQALKETAVIKGELKGAIKV